MTIKDIAKESGYSVGTVSRTLNNQPGVSEKAKKRITEVVKKYHFQLNQNAKHLKKQSKDGIAIIIKGTHNMLFAQIVEIIQDELKKRGYSSSIYYYSEDTDEVKKAITISRERRPYGIMFLGSNLNHFVKSFSAIDIPCMLVTNSAASLKFNNLSSVTTNDENAAKYAVEQLINLGHKNIGIIGGRKDTSYTALRRYDGCRLAFKEYGIVSDEKSSYEEAYFDISEGYRAMQRLLSKNKNITAVFAMADVMAIGAIRAIIDKGLKVPDDISVIGFDGLEIGDYCNPRLTTISQQKNQIALRSVEILIDKIETGGNAIHEVVPFYLTPGESIKKILPGIRNTTKED
ncbi:MAG: LacI family transcriptional regulator [Eubacterium sp.]|nr:LacI family transcriptional regulator [Eubacterium sp.]